MGDDAAPGDPTRPRPRMFGGYELINEIARGGMGVVYRAREVSLDRIVALKMIQPGHLTSPDAWMRFQTEIAASARLNHPHIVPLYESGTVAGAQFFTMRLVEGGTLAAKLEKDWGGCGVRRSSREELQAVARLIIKVARALHHAHHRGVLHRDLKPSNILLDEVGEPLIADFGVAKMLSSDRSATLTLAVLGSPNYMAPELADGRGKDVTVETDVYGLGTILYEALTGTPPFLARTPLETIRRVLSEEPLPPRKINAGIDDDLETICLKCLQKDPAARYHSADEFAADLERWIGSLPIVARPVGPVGAALRWCRRHPGLALVTSLLLLTLVLVAVGASLAALRIRSAEQAVVAQLRESLLDQISVLRSSPVRNGQTSSRELLLQAAALGGSDDYRARLRDEALATFAQPNVIFSALHSGGSIDPHRVLIDPSQKMIARITADSVTLTPVTGGEPKHLIDTEPGAQLDSFSPDGRYLAVRDASRIEIYDTTTTATTSEPRLNLNENQAGRKEKTRARSVLTASMRTHVYSFASQAPLLALEEDNCQISLRELPSGQETKRFALTPDASTQGLHGFSTIRLSPDGALIACARAADNMIELMEVQSGRVLWRTKQSQHVDGMVWHPKYSRLVVALKDGRVLVLRLTNGETIATLAAPASVNQLALNDEDNLLAAACSDHRIRIWDTVSLRLLFEAEYGGQGLTFSRHDKGLRLSTVFQGDRAGWFTIEPSRFFKDSVIAAAAMEIRDCSYSDSGDIITYAHAGRIGFVKGSGHGPRGGMSVSGTPVFALDPRGDFLLAAGRDGIALHPLTRAAEGAVLDIPSTRLVLPGTGWRALAISADGGHIWAVEGKTHLLHGYSRGFDGEAHTLGPHKAVDALAVSPDGRYVASSSGLLLETKIWDTQTRAEVMTLRSERQQRLAFSPDGRWLVVHGDVFDLRRTGTWESVQLPYIGPRPTLGAAAFSQNSQVLALLENQSRIRLFDLQKWRTLGQLVAPEPGTYNALAFSPDGTKLVVGCAGGRLRHWDIAAIHQALDPLGLGW
jgi:WD40 repeat protein